MGKVEHLLTSQSHLDRSLQTLTIQCSYVINSIGFCYINHADEKITAGPWGGDGALTATVSDFAITFLSLH